MSCSSQFNLLCLIQEELRLNIRIAVGTKSLMKSSVLQHKDGNRLRQLLLHKAVGVCCCLLKPSLCLLSVGPPVSHQELNRLFNNPVQSLGVFSLYSLIPERTGHPTTV